MAGVDEIELRLRVIEIKLEALATAVMAMAKQLGLELPDMTETVAALRSMMERDLQNP